ncbi:RING finger domain containing protein [Pyrenophora tritici-repentis]|uniref:RING finger domain containing protein n=1 Tax=Pyrenophora tritici-repentis (strain Pt-1C-BFP) TaxID=426418 RepID=B2W2G5_PYRTR|nr:RING finger domain containing protein [Pyrenophora tritici-repentis Pt-1C-BFP]KAA8620334.1 RING finger domain-containing protein [Pyrenophora tritici-repentis]EDU46451.1 RING finger domain containing protein [Pyrenophora tritici-repentis Pt-1C-BFP]KAG9384611.1 RING finger domain containing protein [Pyrenophora tritici-repentis]KAI1527946.1 RING finger domain containing protein [Pyrenophora tritici-repentis]KAI1538795.1 RING finger domain containing protein [Pyrenophora tritici-repentis]
MSSTPTVDQKTVGDAAETARTSKDIIMPVAEMAALQLNEDTAKYECCICGDDILLSKGVVTCAEHVMCNECIVDAHAIALKDNSAFPTKCCAPIPFEQVEHLLSPEMREAYSMKIKEHNTPIHSRIYCSKEACSSFIPPTQFDSTSFIQTVAPCTCGCVTCTECSKEWDSEGHKCHECVVESDNTLRPKWLPEYSPTCRIKQCPDCTAWIELEESCNHMYCCHCRTQFCFICMMLWDGFHEEVGCPAYGDPPAGYDEEGFELSWRGLHFETGLDRNGHNLYDITYSDDKPIHAHEPTHIYEPLRFHVLDNDLGVEHIENAEADNYDEFWANAEGLQGFFGED